MNSIKCYNCGLVNWATTGGCKRCGAVFTNAGPADYEPYQAGPTNHQAYQQHDAAAPDGQWEHGYGEEGYGEQEQQQHQQQHHTARDYYAPQYQSAPYNQSYYPESPKQKGLAIASLVLGILGAVTFGLFGLGALLGLIFGIVAYRRAKRNPAQYGGEGQALAGIIISSISILMFLYIAVVAAIAIPNLLASRRAANEGAAISTLRTLSSAEATYQATVGGSSAGYGTMEELFRAGLIDAKLASKLKNGYRFEITVTPPSSVEPAKYEVVAIPLTYGTTGNRSFFIDETGVVRGADRRGAEATVSDKPLGNTRVSEVDDDYDGTSPPTRRMRY